MLLIVIFVCLSCYIINIFNVYYDYYSYHFFLPNQGVAQSVRCTLHIDQPKPIVLISFCSLAWGVLCNVMQWSQRISTRHIIMSLLIYFNDSSNYINLIDFESIYTIYTISIILSLALYMWYECASVRMTFQRSQPASQWIGSYNRSTAFQ